jgi:hypothetical protein
MIDDNNQMIEDCADTCVNGECIVDISSFGLYSVARIVDNSYFESCLLSNLKKSNVS